MTTDCHRQCNRVKLNHFSLPSFQLSKYRKRRRYFAKDQSRRENSQVITFCLCNIGRASDIWPSVKTIFYFFFIFFFFALKGHFQPNELPFFYTNENIFTLTGNFLRLCPYFYHFSFLLSLVS